MKEQIIDIAIRQLRLGGYDNLNFAAIAEELGTTRANLHHHFKNKEGLGKAAVEQYIKEDKSQIDAILSDNHDDIQSFLKALEQHMIDIILGEPEHTACIGSQFVRDSVAPQALRKLVVNRFREEAADITAKVESLLKSRDQISGERDAAFMAFQVVTSLHGLEMMGLVEPDKQAFARRIRGTLTSLG
jgi:TetR/AcrR family transcriptional repressor of nem operon